MDYAQSNTHVYLVTETVHGHTYAKEVAPPVVFESKEEAEAYAAEKQNEWDGLDGSISRYVKEVEWRPAT